MTVTALIHERIRRRLCQVAVVDNGHGMSPSILRQALQYGNGTRLADRTGIGRFGMGLPNSSLSQAQRVSVYTWRKGIKAAQFSYLDVVEISEGSMTEVPPPKRQALPGGWGHLCDSPSGTLVLWSDLDRCKWHTTRALLKNSEGIIGRIYRRFIQSGAIRISLIAIDHKTGKVVEERHAIPNDPLYLMPISSCPAPFDNTAMFEPFGDKDVPQCFTYTSGGKKHTVKVKFSCAKPEAQHSDGGQDAGHKSHGKHAKQNVGVSIMRADRELEMLQAGWVNSWDTRERWWGCEIDIPPALDEVFGVTNTKQSATVISEISAVDGEQIAEQEGYRSYIDLKDNLQKDGDPRFLVFQIKDYIESNLRAIRAHIKNRAVKKRTSKGTSTPAEEVATIKTKIRQQDGQTGQSDQDESAEPDARVVDLIPELECVGGLTHAEAQALAEDVIQSGRKYVFTHASSDSAAFFSVRPRAGVLHITLNSDHPVYEKLLALLEDGDALPVQERLERCLAGLQFIFMAWARMEDENSARQEEFWQTRQDWGLLARQFLGGNT